MSGIGHEALVVQVKKLGLTFDPRRARFGYVSGKDFVCASQFNFTPIWLAAATKNPEWLQETQNDLILAVIKADADRAIQYRSTGDSK